MSEKTLTSFWKIFENLRASDISLNSSDYVKLLWRVVTSITYDNPARFLEKDLQEFSGQSGVSNLPEEVLKSIVGQVRDLGLSGVVDEKELILKVFIPLLDKINISAGQKYAGFRLPSEIISFAVEVAQIENRGGKILVKGLAPWELTNLPASAGFMLRSGLPAQVAREVFSVIHSGAKLYTSEESVDDDYDVVVTFPPFGERGSYSFVPLQRGRISSTEQAIAEGLEFTNNSGKVVVLTAPGFLFGGGAIERAREYLVSKDLVETVVDLPKGMLQPYSGVGTCFIVINKQKPLRQKNKVRFVDATSFTLSTGKRSFKLDQNELMRVYQSKEDLDSFSVSVQEEKVLQMNSSLSSGRYLFEKEYNEAEAGERILRLGDLAEKIPGIRNSSDTENIPYLAVSDLKKSWVSARIADEDNTQLKRLKDISSKAISGIKIVHGEALFVSKTFGGQLSLRPTYSTINVPVAIPPFVKALRVHKERVDVNYLLQELSSEYVRKQLGLLVKGSAISQLTDSDLLSLRLRVPESLQEQRARVKSALEAQDIAADEIAGLRKQLAEREKEIFEEFNIFKHNFGKPFRQFRSTLSLIERYLRKKNDSQQPVSMDDLLSEHSQATLSGGLDLLAFNLDLASKLIRSGESVNKFLVSDMSLKSVELRKFTLEKVVPLFKNDPDFDFELNVAIGDYPYGNDLNAFVGKINEEALLNVFQNFIDNAKSHGLQNKEHKKMKLVVKEFFSEIEKDGENLTTLVFSICNNGEPLPENFTIDKFIKKGLSFGVNAGSGYGGYSIHRTVEKFGGDLWLDGPEEDYPVCFSFDIPVEFKLNNDL